MRVAVVDVGSNTVRMLVAAVGSTGLETVSERKARIGLGSEIALEGRISPAKIEAAGVALEAFAHEARELGCARLAVVVASPGRQAENADRLVRRLQRATGQAPLVLSAEEEARLAWDGAISWRGRVGDTVAVCDVGGGSTQVAFGVPEHGPVWLKSVDIGSLRLTERLLAEDPPGKRAIAEAVKTVRQELDGLLAPLPMSAIAVGGSARALRKLVGKMLGPDELGSAISQLRRRSSGEIAAELGIDRMRARTMVAGAVLLAELQRRLGVPLEVVPAGLREGVALRLAAQASAA